MLYMWCNSLGDTNGNPKLGFNAARSIICGATNWLIANLSWSGFQCRTQHFMWCNPRIVTIFLCRGVSMPHAAFYVVQQNIANVGGQLVGFQCRTQHFMWCNLTELCSTQSRNVSMPHAAFYVVQLLKSVPWTCRRCFNAARSILCGATVHIARLWWFQQRFNAARSILCGATPSPLRRLVSSSSFNAARSILCGATTKDFLFVPPSVGFNAARSILCGATPLRQHFRIAVLCFNAARSILCGATARKMQGKFTQKFQCRTQHFMWCNFIHRNFSKGSRGFNAARSILCGATTSALASISLVIVSMPHAAFYVVQQLRVRWHGERSRVSMPHAAFYVVQRQEYPATGNRLGFQCRTQHFMWCNVMVSIFDRVREGFNAARSILCGATMKRVKGLHDVGFNAARSILCGATPGRMVTLATGEVSMPHAAFYVVQQFSDGDYMVDVRFQCRTQHFMWCNADYSMSGTHYLFQCRTQHYMWCNKTYINGNEVVVGFNAARSIICGATNRYCTIRIKMVCFNAARSILCGATQ